MRLTDAQRTLVEEHAHLVHAAIYTRFGRWDVRYHPDLLADGYEGLCDAARRYDPERGVQFRTYAWDRIIGAAWDGHRNFHARGGGLGSRYSPARPTRCLDEPIGPSGDMTLADVLPGSADVEGEVIARLDDDEGMIVEYLEDLDVTQRFVVVERLKGRKMLGIAEDLGVSEARVCQLLASAARGLRRFVDAA